MARSVFSSAACVAVVFVGTLAAADKRPAETAADAEARELVQQALLAESQGDNAQRAQRLSAAILAAPQSPPANWHLAHVRVENEWLPVSVAVHRFVNDPHSAKYAELRQKVIQSTTPAASAKTLHELALWCQRNQMADAARVHFAQLLMHPAANKDQGADAIRALDLHQVNGKWFTGEELAAQRAATKALDLAFAHWEGKLQGLRTQLDSEGAAARAKAAEELAQIDDPAIISVLESLLAGGGEHFHLAVIKRLTGFPQYEATVTLARLAVLSDSAAARDAATVALKDRPIAEFVPLLLGELAAPFKSQFRVGWDAAGRIGYTQAVLQEGVAGNRLLLTSAISAQQLVGFSRTIDNTVRAAPREPIHQTRTIIPNSGPTPAEAFASELATTQAIAAQRELQLVQANDAVAKSNRRLFEVLESTTGQPLQRQPAAWGEWWQSFNEYRPSRPTQFAYQHSNCTYLAATGYTTVVNGTRNVSCFVKGTPVRTERGVVAIETILPGDRVLAQDQESGELTFKPVLAVTLRPPSKVTRIKAGGEEVVTTLGHPFWVLGRGWRMAKQLQAGDLLHTLGGATTIESVQPLADDQPAHNLVVDDFNTYFVGQAGLLVHDNEFRKPTTAVVPGLPAAN